MTVAIVTSILIVAPVAIFFWLADRRARKARLSEAMEPAAHDA